ncbi:MAG: hypothetical protein IT308_00155 [Anaerolineaceae bacterium]|nr:hypothetical protein [Anaerolineaceae bacterium]
MMDFGLNMPIVLGTFGVVFFGLWIAALLGLWKKWYWRSQSGLVYGYIGIALACLVGGFQPQLLRLFNDQQWLIDTLMILSLGIALLIAFLSPRFLKPKWIQQIECEPKWVYKEMVAQIKNGYKWQEKMVDYNTLETWIKEIKKKPRQKNR